VERRRHFGRKFGEHEQLQEDLLYVDVFPRRGFNAPTAGPVVCELQEFPRLHGACRRTGWVQFTLVAGDYHGNVRFALTPAARSAGLIASLRLKDLFLESFDFFKAFAIIDTVDENK